MKILEKFSLRKKVIVITGGAGFLGKQFANVIAKAGGTPVLLDVKYNKAKLISENIKIKLNAEAFAVKCDVTNEKQVRNSLKKIKKKFEKKEISGLINNAALNPQPKKYSGAIRNNLENFSIKSWNEEINVGLTGALICSKIFGTHFAKRKKGSIINISSDLGIKAPNQKIYNHLNFVKPVTYSVIKHGIIGLSKYICSYWGEYGIRCNTIAPTGVYNKQDKKFVKKLIQNIPFKRMAKLEDFDGIIIYLLSDLSSFQNGSLISIDGGRAVY